MITTPFSIPIFQYSVDDWNTSKQKVLSTINPYINGNTDYYEDRGGAYYGRSKKDPPPYMENIAETLHGCMNNLANDIKCSVDDMYIEAMWYEQLNYGDYHCCHNHGALGLSATYFVSFDSEEHEPTRFYAPHLDYLTGHNMFYQPEAKEGDVIFFPSSLLHEAPRNNSTIPRLIISFNIRSSLWG